MKNLIRGLVAVGALAALFYTIDNALDREEAHQKAKQEAIRKEYIQPQEEADMRDFYQKNAQFYLNERIANARKAGFVRRD